MKLYSLFWSYYQNKAVVAELYHDQSIVIRVSQTWEMTSDLRLTDVLPA